LSGGGLGFHQSNLLFDHFAQLFIKRNTLLMTINPINVAGIEIPSDSPVFLAALGAHVLFGISCVGAGVGAMLSGKRPGRHPRIGTISSAQLKRIDLASR